MVLLFLYLFLIGLVFGSFFNVCIYRLESSESIIKGRSHCQSCKHKLNVLDLIPVFSWLFLRGRCRYCHQPIAIRYPFVELLTALLFVLTAVFFGVTLDALIYLVVISTLIMMAFIDLDTMLIRDRFIVTLTLCGLALLVLHPDSWRSALLGAGLVSLPLLLLAVLTHGIGLGDVKLMAAAGLVLGGQRILLAMILGAVFASLVAIYQMLLHHKSGKDQMPLGPYLALGIVVSLFFGEAMITWYLALL